MNKISNYYFLFDVSYNSNVTYNIIFIGSARKKKINGGMIFFKTYDYFFSYYDYDNIKSFQDLLIEILVIRYTTTTYIFVSDLVWRMQLMIIKD